MELFDSKMAMDVEALFAKHLATRFGPMESHSGKMQFLNGAQPSEADIVAAREQAIWEANRQCVKAEARRRILAVVKDEATQINMLGWLTLNLSTDNGFIVNDLRMAQRIFEWISAMQFMGRTLANDPTYHDDKHWPKPPDGAREFVEKF